MIWSDLTIVTSCTGYGKYLQEWADSIIAQKVRPGRVCILTHGTHHDQIAAINAASKLRMASITVILDHIVEQQDFGVARNHAVAMADSGWVMHLDADDTLMPHALAVCQPMADTADVISAGYERIGRITAGMLTRARVYTDADGMDALDLPAICSGNSPFRRSFWEQSPYRTDMFGAWDTALWIGFARLGARFRATTRTIFNYRQHPDSIFSQRQRHMSWKRVHTTATLRALRRNYRGVAVIVPRDYAITNDRARNWSRVKAHYESAHPAWQIVEGHCPSITWVKGAAIADALNHSNAEILVIADADCIVDPSALDAAVIAVSNGAPWAMPHLMVRRLTEESTITVLPNIPHDLDWRFDPFTLARDIYEGAPGGGIVVITRRNYDAIGGIPHAFTGWGSEDRALAVLCETLLGPCARGTADLIHLHHSEQPKTGLTANNLQTLRRLGQAALNGKDALVIAVTTLARGGVSRVYPIPHALPPIDHAAIAARQNALARRRRRAP